MHDICLSLLPAAVKLHQISQNQQENVQKCNTCMKCFAAPVVVTFKIAFLVSKTKEVEWNVSRKMK